MVVFRAQGMPRFVRIPLRLRHCQQEMPSLTRQRSIPHAQADIRPRSRRKSGFRWLSQQRRLPGIVHPLDTGIERCSCSESWPAVSSSGHVARRRRRQTYLPLRRGCSGTFFGSFGGTFWSAGPGRPFAPGWRGAPRIAECFALYLKGGLHEKRENAAARLYQDEALCESAV